MEYKEKSGVKCFPNIAVVFLDRSGKSTCLVKNIYTSSVPVTEEIKQKEKISVEDT